ncbi:CHAT domain-containing tetratricopeptide repeat protein [Povalibacter sp.]|uniref:CHAT domain-containing protein n=1 Tax=Povalibacter sp. TaxID=1962978 RepID=UPI002F3F7795
MSVAYALIQRGLEQTRQDPEQYAQWLEILWRYFVLQDDYAKGRDALEEALRRLAGMEGRELLVASVMNNLSYSFVLRGELAQAKEYLRRAIVLANQNGNQKLLAELYYNIGDAYRKSGELLVARRYFEAAREYYARNGDAFLTQLCDLKLGTVSRESGRVAEAVRKHTAALDFFRREGSYREVLTELELARDYAAQRQYDSAEAHARNVLNDERSLPEPRIDSRILLLQILNDRRQSGIAGLEGEAGKAIVAIKGMLSESSSRQRSSIARPTYQLEFARQAIRHYAMSGELTKVDGFARSAMETARRVSDDLRSSNDDNLAWLSQAQPVLNEYVKALFNLDRSRILALLESFYGQQATSLALRNSTSMGWMRETQAVDSFERYKAAEHALIDANVALEQETREMARASLRRAVNQHQHARDLARDAYLALRHLEKPTGPGFEPAPGAPLQPASIATGDIVVRYFIQDDVSFCIALAGRDVGYFALPPRSELTRVISIALEGLQSPVENDRALAALSTLSRWLPRDFMARHADASRLIVVPDDAMHEFPFAAVNFDPSPGTYDPLVKHFEIVRTKSVHAYYEPRSSDARVAMPNDIGPDVVIFADPVVARPPVDGVSLSEGTAKRWSNRAANLPNARREALRVSEALAPRRTKTYVGERADNAALLADETRTSPILHIATHGYYSASTPDIVGIATATRRPDREDYSGGFLSLTDLFTQSFANRLVVVSGCETMRGQNFNGWGVRSLGDGFLSRGAGSVIGTLWNVSDEAMARIMDTFYRELASSNGDSSRSLAVAQRALLNSLRFAKPYYWSGIVLESSHRSMDQHAF